MPMDSRTNCPSRQTERPLLASIAYGKSDVEQDFGFDLDLTSCSNVDTKHLSCFQIQISYRPSVNGGRVPSVKWMPPMVVDDQARFERINAELCLTLVLIAHFEKSIADSTVCASALPSKFLEIPGTCCSILIQ